MLVQLCAMGPVSMSESDTESRLERRLVQAEAQIETLKERSAELSAAVRQMKQSALWTRVFLLFAALAAFFFIRSFGAS